jgi:hypothetical protein
MHRLRREAESVTDSDVSEGDEFYDPTGYYEDESTTATAENLIKKMTETVASRMHSSYIVSRLKTMSRM